MTKINQQIGLKPQSTLQESLVFTDTEKMSQLFQEAVNKAIETHRLKGESIAVSDETGKVKIIPASEIPKPD